MKIEAQFDSIEEMMGFAIRLVGGTTAAEAIKKQKVDQTAKTKVTAKEEAPEEDSVPEEGTQRAEDLPSEEETKTFTLEEVRASLAVLTRTGKQKQVKDLLTFFKAKNLTSVDPKDYAALMEKAGAL